MQKRVRGDAHKGGFDMTRSMGVERHAVALLASFTIAGALPLAASADDFGDSGYTSTGDSSYANNSGTDYGTSSSYDTPDYETTPDVSAGGSEKSNAEAAGWGGLAALSTLVYAPTKVAYAVGGSVVGGFAWLLSAGDNDVAKAVITPATQGDYVVTPSNLRGKEQLEFIGQPKEPQESYAAPTHVEPEPY